MSTAQHQVSYEALCQFFCECIERRAYQHKNFLFFCRADKTLQDIVYKLVPGLFKGETRFLEATLKLLVLCFRVMMHFFTNGRSLFFPSCVALR